GSTERRGDRGGHVPAGPHRGLREPVHQDPLPGRVRPPVGGVRPPRRVVVPDDAGPGGHFDGHFLVHAYGLGAVAQAPDD
ncbi:MAG: Arylsulfatase, partial [uncultured Arthrobacter sp.]